MKTRWKTIIGLSLVSVVGVTLMMNNNIVAQASDLSPDKVVMHGTYEDCFSPDTAYVTMGVMEDKITDTVSEVATLEYNPTNLDIVLSTLENNGITEENISTMQIDMPYEMFENMRTNSKRVANVVEFKTTDMENLDNLISTISQNNVAIKNIRYSLENTESNYSTVLNGAINNATSKLNSLVPDADYRVAEIIEEGCYSPTMYNSYRNSNGEVSTNSRIYMCGNVRVVFEKIGE